MTYLWNRLSVIGSCKNARAELMVPVQCRDVTVAAGLQEHSNRLCGLPIRTQNAQLHSSLHWSITKQQWLQETAWEASSVPPAHG